MGQGLKKQGVLIVSIDVEDWPQSTWDRSLEITKRAQHNTETLLEILSEHAVTVTMFVLGKFAKRFPETVERIAAEGHEVASHGYGHIEIFEQTPEQFDRDVRKSKGLLEDLTGQPVVGYRAPDFSLVSSTTWALEILAELGFQYDSSIFPVKNNRYGISTWPTTPVRVKLPSGRSILELPIATVPFFGRNWPVGGGGYHRLLPWKIIQKAIEYHLRRKQPFMAYCHPYEFDSKEFDQMNNIAIPAKTRLHQGLGRKGFRNKFEKMLKTFPTQPASLLVSNNQWPTHTLAETIVG